jgi:hypothetical protein
MSDGKQLEALVAFIEKTLLPTGFDVKTNERVYNDERVQIAEFDIEISGMIGSTAFYWLIECRDRPSSGPAPVSWIEQLVGRRDRFRFNKVTAVSTTGFAAGAAEFAKRTGIELREVRAVTPEDFNWLLFREMPLTKCSAKLERATLLIDEAESEERREALRQTIVAIPPDAAFLKSSKTGAVGTAAAAFLAAVESVGTMFDDVQPNGPSKKVRIHNTCPEGEFYIVETPLGPINIHEIDFIGELQVEVTSAPLVTTTRYEHAEDRTLISQLAGFAPHELLGRKYSLEFHRMGEDGETHVLLRRV